MDTTDLFGEGGFDSAALMGRLAEENPALALIARYLGSLNTGETEDYEGEVIEREEVVEMMEAELFELRQKLDDALHEAASARAALRRLAGALGACEGCWGEDPQCRNCLGDGRPGAFIPDRLLFGELVLPAVRRLPRRPAIRADTATANASKTRVMATEREVSDERI